MVQVKTLSVNYRCAVRVAPSEPEHIVKRINDTAEEIARCMSCEKKRCTNCIEYLRKKRRFEEEW